MEKTIPLSLLILEDDKNACIKFAKCIESRDDINLIAIVNSDIKALTYVKAKKPEALIVDVELNNSTSGNTDSFDFLEKVNNLKPHYNPIIIITTLVSSSRTHEILHNMGVDLVVSKNHPTYSQNYVLNRALSFRTPQIIQNSPVLELIQDEKDKISELIFHELDLVGITRKLVGRQYIHDSIIHMITNTNENQSTIQYLTSIHKKSHTTINNGIQTAINRGWQTTAIEDLEVNYTAKVNYTTGVPTPMEFLYYYEDKIKKLL